MQCVYRLSIQGTDRRKSGTQTKIFELEYRSEISCIPPKEMNIVFVGPEDPGEDDDPIPSVAFGHTGVFKVESCTYIVSTGYLNVSLYKSSMADEYSIEEANDLAKAYERLFGFTLCE